jgi:hypothetical protein
MCPLGLVQNLKIIYSEKFAIIFYLLAFGNEPEAFNVFFHTAGRSIELYTVPVFDNSCSACPKTDNCPLI